MVSDPRKRSKEGVARKEVQEEGTDRDTQEASVVSGTYILVRVPVQVLYGI